MQIVIELDDNVFVRLFDNGIDPSKEDREEIEGAIRDGIVLPKGHGRLIDADDIDNHIIGHVDTRGCPTIIPADKEESE